MKKNSHFADCPLEVPLKYPYKTASVANLLLLLLEYYSMETYE
jgi:hypothetical protein